MENKDIARKKGQEYAIECYGDDYFTDCGNEDGDNEISITIKDFMEGYITAEKDKLTDLQEAFNAGRENQQMTFEQWYNKTK